MTTTTKYKLAALISMIYKPLNYSLRMEAYNKTIRHQQDGDKPTVVDFLITSVSIER